MKLIYLFNGRLPTEKAHGLQIAKMCEAFARDGNQVTLISSYRKNPISENPFLYYGLQKNFTYRQGPGFDISWLPGKPAYYSQTIISALVLVASAFRYRKDGAVFYARDYWSLFFLSLFGFNPVAELHDYRLHKPRRYIRLILNKSRAIIVNSRGTRDLLSRSYTFPESKILIAPNGVDLDYFAIRESREEVREQLGMPAGTVLGYTGRLETAGVDKGVGLLLEAISIMEHKNLLLYIVGGPDTHVEKLKEEAKKLGLQQRVVFTGQVAHSLVPRYLRAMDAVILPLATGQHAITTSPIKLFEYMAAGKVIVASDLPSVREIIDSSAAVFFRPGDARDLATRLDSFLGNPDLAESLARQSLEKAQHYSWFGRAKIIKEFIASHGN